VANNLLLSQDALGVRSRAAQAARALQPLNPMVDVSVASGALHAQEEAFFGQFDLVAVSGEPRAALLRLNDMTRRFDVKFLAADCFGGFGFAFLDFLDGHEYAVSEAGRAAESTNGAPAAAKRKVSAADDGGVASKNPSLQEPAPSEAPDEEVIVRRRMQFCSLADALCARDWCSGLSGRALRRLPAALLLMHCRFVAQENGSDAEPAALKAAWTQVAARFSLPVGLLPDETLARAVDEDVHGGSCGWDAAPPAVLAAIVGGIAGQELIKALSQREAPLRNVFVFDAKESSGAVKELGVVGAVNCKV